ncbi:hypothetical protein GGI22_005751, partial [Coemansia erecta]
MTASAAALPSPASTHPALPLPPPTYSYSQLYPAPRTANMFSLPFERLSEPHRAHNAQNTATHGAEMAGGIFEHNTPDTPRSPYPFPRTGNHHCPAATTETPLGFLQGEEILLAASSAYSAAAFMAANATCNCHAVHGTSLPLPLRALPFWCSTSGPRKCIIYLEPRRGSPLYTAIEGFLHMSAQLFGPTEAHQYHPHSSMTGFIDISDGAAGQGDDGCAMTSGQLVTKIACHIHSFVSSFLNGSTAHGVATPRVGSVATIQDYPHKGTHKVQVALDSPDAFRNIIDTIQTAVPQARIRGKRMGHISLSYYNKHVKTDKAVTTDMAQSLDALARSFLCDPRVTDPSLNQWDIAFYELAF